MLNLAFYTLGLGAALVYLALALRRAYGNTSGGAAARALGIGLAYGFMTVALTQAIIIPIVLA